MGMEGLEAFEFAPYFESRVLNNPKRAHLIPFVAATVNEPEEVKVQKDGRIQHWRYVPEPGYRIRVITTADRARFNVHEGSNYTRKQRRTEE